MVLGILLVIFCECGILLGFFVPRDILLFISGLFIATGAIDINLGLFSAVPAIAHWTQKRRGARPVKLAGEVAE